MSTLEAVRSSFSSSSDRAWRAFLTLPPLCPFYESFFLLEMLTFGLRSSNTSSIVTSSTITLFSISFQFIRLLLLEQTVVVSEVPDCRLTGTLKCTNLVPIHCNVDFSRASPNRIVSSMAVCSNRRVATVTGIGSDRHVTTRVGRGSDRCRGGSGALRRLS